MHNKSRAREHADIATHNSRCAELQACHDAGEIDLRLPTPYRGGTVEKVCVMAVRYSMGAPIWIEGDGVR